MPDASKTVWYQILAPISGKCVIGIKDFTAIFLHSRGYYTLLSTADIDTIPCIVFLSVCGVLLLAMATPVWKTFTTDVRQMQRWRHHMTAPGL